MSKDVMDLKAIRLLLRGGWVRNTNILRVVGLRGLPTPVPLVQTPLLRSSVCPDGGISSIQAMKL